MSFFPLIRNLAPHWHLSLCMVLTIFAPQAEQKTALELTAPCPQDWQKIILRVAHFDMVVPFRRVIHYG